MFNVQLGAGMLAYYAGQSDLSAEEEEIPSQIPGKRAKAIRQPVGVVVGIAPWNAPVILGVRAVAAPLAYGNTVVLKASEVCPRTHGAIVDALRDAGVPSGVINLVTNDPEDAAEVVEELIAHPAVRRISFTGSTRVGRIIAGTAARHLKRVLLELGGNAPLIVLADADLERAVAAANFGSFMHQGQICMSTERIVIDRSIAEDFAERLAGRASSLRMGDPREPDTEIGPLVNEAAVERIAEHVEDALSRGAKLISGGEAQGLFFPPTVLMDVTPAMRIYSEESFGPVVAIVPVDSVDEAVQVANDTEYGLSAGVFSTDLDAAMQIARRLETGICHINDATVNDEPPMPFGGVKHSGWGRFGGKAALEEFTELRWITIQDSPRQYAI
jgi:benzaldehyde dehydrogenase (NAD)